MYFITLSFKLKFKKMNQTGRILLMLIVFVSTISFVQAQRGERSSRTLESMAERNTKMMTDSLALSDAQKEKIAEVNLKYAQKMKEVRQNARAKATDDNPMNVREEMQNLRKEQNVELKKYMTTEQYTKWNEIQKNQRANRRGPRDGKGRRGGKGKRQKDNDVDKEEQSTPENGIEKN